MEIYSFSSFYLCDYSDSVGYAILLNFLVYVTLPVPLNFAGILLGIGTFVIYVTTVIGLAQRELYFWHQVCIADALFRILSDFAW